MFHQICQALYSEVLAVDYRGAFIRKEEVPTELDPIDPQVVGRLKVKSLVNFCKRAGLDILSRSLAVLEEARVRSALRWGVRSTFARASSRAARPAARWLL